jgi:hypothetical protein
VKVSTDELEPINVSGKTIELWLTEMETAGANEVKQHVMNIAVASERQILTPLLLPFEL